MTDIAALAQEIVNMHEDVDSGADIPVHVYKMAKDALSRLTTPPPSSKAQAWAKAFLKAYETGSDDFLNEETVAEWFEYASRLTTPPPDEIARLIERWSRQSFIPHEDPRIIVDTKEALCALAQRIRELDAERATAQAELEEADGMFREICARGNLNRQRADRMEHERDAIRRKTIEECAKIIHPWDSPKGRSLAARIRALAHSESEGQ